ncbi:MAG: maleate cis-trans isomerase family protein [Thiolinea sp.]
MDTQFQRITTQTEFDSGPGKYRIGLLVLSNDYVIERDFINMRPSDEVALFTSRMLFSPDCSIETLQQTGPRITDATSLLIPDGRLDVVAYGCTSGTAVLGFEGVQANIHKARPGVHCVTPLTASLAALDRFNAERLAVLTPYIDDINTQLANYLNSQGKTITAFNSFKLADTEAMAKLSSESIYQAALAADTDTAEALFISCTAIRAVDVVERIEQKLGKPVVTAVQALFWQSLQLAGFTGRIEGYGRLLLDGFRHNEKENSHA